MLSNLTPGARLELYMAGLCFSMFAAIAIGGWWVSQRQATVGENLPVADPRSTLASIRNDFPREPTMQPGTAKGGADGPYQLATSRSLY